MYSDMKRSAFLMFSFLLPALSMAEGESPIKAISSYDFMMGLTLTMVGFVVILVGVLILLMVKLRDQLDAMLVKTEDEIEYANQDFWSKAFQLHPLKAERKLLMAHAYDGIQELDNPTPPWFMFLFYSTILFAVVYGFIYHGIGDGNIMQNEYVAEIKDAEIMREAYLKKYANSINENNVKLVVAKDELAEGKTIFNNNCVACHGAGGEGKVGPNLTDTYSIHGSGIKMTFKTVSEGVPEKGMIAWKKQLNPLQVQLVSSYVISLKGSNPPNPKAPQGQTEGASITDTLKNSL